MVVLRGVLLILFAILLFTNPGLTAISLAIWLAALLIVDGIFTLIGAIMSWKETEDRWFILADGILSLVLGVLLLRAPEVTLLFVSLTFAFWFIFSGLARIAMGVQLRKEIKGEGWMILGGALSMIFGLYLFSQPGLSLSTLLITAAIFSLIAGVFLLFAGFKLRKGDKWLDDKAAQMAS
jgi:uncharacterized membrane protein HdeD (DUF308 family)